MNQSIKANNAALACPEEREAEQVVKEHPQLRCTKLTSEDEVLIITCGDRAEDATSNSPVFSPAKDMESKYPDLVMTGR